MIATYILILCLSTMLAAWAGLRLWQRVAPLMGIGAAQSGLCAVVPAIAFLIVVGAPAAVLFFSSATIIALLTLPMLQRTAPRALWLAASIATALLFARAPDAALVFIPLPAVYALAFFYWLGMATSADHAPTPLRDVAMATILACVPLAIAPLLNASASAVALDAAILASAWFGVLLLAQPHIEAGAAARLSSVLLLGYIQVAAFWHGAWPAALASLIVWGGALAFATTQKAKRAHARLEELLPRA